MIAVNWGTTNFRAFRLDARGSILGILSSSQGILSIQPGGFASALTAEIGDWLAAGEDRILLSGMVGSRQGWVEAAYVKVPACIDDLAAGLVHLDFAPAEAYLVPGLIGTDRDGVPEVMRGEETEIVGALSRFEEHATFCLPGTHSKWAKVRAGRITSFETCMTGEVFRALQDHTILGRLLRPGPILLPSFLRGVERSAGSGSLLHHLFSARTMVLTGKLGADEAASFLSGMLIGHEVRSEASPGTHVTLVGAEDLCSLYAHALTSIGVSSGIAAPHAAARGLQEIARRVLWT